MWNRRIESLLRPLWIRFGRALRLVASEEEVTSGKNTEIFLQRRLYLLVVIGFILISSFLIFLGTEYSELQRLHDREYHLQRLVDQVSEAHMSLRTSARLGAATTDRRWERLHEEKETEMDDAIQKLINLYSEEEQTNLGFELQVYNVQLLELENRAFYLVRDGRSNFSEASRLLDSPGYQKTVIELESAVDRTEKSMISCLKQRISSLRNRAAIVSLMLLTLSILPAFPIIRVLRMTRTIERERGVAERQLTRLNACLVGFESDSMLNIQSLVDICGDLLEADGVAYQRIEGDSVCTVGWWGHNYCRPAESLKGSLAEGVIEAISSIPLVWNLGRDPELLVKIPALKELRCKTYIAQRVHSGDEAIGILHIFYSKETAPGAQNLRLITIIASAIAPEERRLKAVETLRASESNYRLMADNATDLILRATFNGTMIYISPASKKLLDYSPSELQGTSLERLWHPDDIQACWERSAQGYLTLIEGISVHRLKTKAGEYRWFETVSRQVINNEERWGREMILVSREITERKQAENALLREREQLAVTLRSITDGVISTDLQQNIVLMNRVAETLTGWTAAEAVGHKLSEVFCVPALYRANGDLASGDDGTYNLMDASLKSRNGSILAIEGSCAPILHFDESIIGHLVVFRDQSEKQRLQAQVALSSKLQSIGQLAAGIAHEINTPMQFINDNNEFVRKASNDFMRLLEIHRQLDGECRKAGYFPELVQKIDSMVAEIDADYLVAEIPIALKETASGIERVTKLVKAMKTFSHPTQGKMQLCDLNQSIEATVNVSRNEWKYISDLEMDLDPALPLVPCLVDEINQVVLNMITNSVDSIKDVINAGRSKRGRIAISTHAEDSDVRIVIQDSGTGMPEETMAKIFDPFYTTKEPGKGTGQGLAISHDIIVNKHHGRIDVESEVDNGTRFTIVLPLVAAEPEANS